MTAALGDPIRDTGAVVLASLIDSGTEWGEFRARWSDVDPAQPDYDFLLACETFRSFALVLLLTTEPRAAQIFRRELRLLGRALNDARPVTDYGRHELNVHRCFVRAIHEAYPLAGLPFECAADGLSSPALNFSNAAFIDEIGTA